MQQSRELRHLSGFEQVKMLGTALLVMAPLLPVLGLAWFMVRAAGMDRSADEKRRDKILDRIPGTFILSFIESQLQLFNL